MMEIVLGDGQEPAKPFAARGVMLEQFDTGMAKGNLDHHEGQVDDQRGQLHGNDQEPQGKKHCEQCRFQIAKGKNSIGGGRDGLMVGPMKPDKRANVQQPMSVARMANGNTLVTTQQPWPGRAYELDRKGQVVKDLALQLYASRAYRR